MGEFLAQIPDRWTVGSGNHRRQNLAGQHRGGADPGHASDGRLPSWRRSSARPRWRWTARKMRSRQPRGCWKLSTWGQGGQRRRHADPAGPWSASGGGRGRIPLASERCPNCTTMVFCQRRKVCSGTVEKGHGYIEQRHLRASAGLLLDWPYLQQDFRVARTEHVKRGEPHDTVYGITSLGPDQANPQQLGHGPGTLEHCRKRAALPP